MNDRALAEVKLGAFVLTALAILAAASLWIAGVRLHGEQAEYTILMKDSGGMLPGDRVRVAGVAVGRIEAVRLHPGEAYPVALRVAINRGIAVKRDASAQLATEGLLGKRYLALDPGSAGAPPLAPGQAIRAEESLDLQQALASLQALSTHAIAVLDRAGKLLDQASSDFLSAQNAAHLRESLAELQALLKTSRPELLALLTRFNAVSQKLDAGMSDLPAIMAKLSALEESLQAALGPEGSRLTGVLTSAKGALDATQGALGLVNDNRARLEATLRDVQVIAENFRSLSATLKERPYSLVRITPPPARVPGEGAKESAR
jgi:phospholipid/cholesterol/gamma-HCH transport system substrate-binding protein